jgi:hypothetical protein
MTEQRAEAHATIAAGRQERCPGGELLQLVSVTLTDASPATHEVDGRRPDVSCPLRPTEARQLAARLHRLADQAERLRVR